jgi:hypothetical protein
LVFDGGGAVELLPQCQPPPPTHKSQSYGKSTALSSSNTSPKKHRANKVKAVPPPVEKTPEEIEAEERAKVKRKLTALRPSPTPKQVFTARQKKWAFSFLNQPSQYEWNKKDDYTCCLDKQVEAASKTRSTSASRKRDVPQLGEQAKQSVSLPKVFASDASGSVAQPSQDHAYDFATEAGLTLS